jgi:hypothetical protein
MARMSIQQFRAALSDRFGPGASLRAYHALARRPSGTIALRGEWTPWSAAADRPAVALAGWGDWSGPPARIPRA